jgi:hypothetical protein
MIMSNAEMPKSQDKQSGEGVILTPNHASARQKAERSDDALTRFLGGSPSAVFLRLLAASLIVGFFLVWLDIRPFEVFRALDRFVHRLWDMGFDALREIGQYILAGAVIVVPVWFLSRLLKSGR